MKNKNLYDEVLNSNINDDAKKQILNLFNKGYGLYFSRNEKDVQRTPIIELVNEFNPGTVPHCVIEGDNLDALIAMDNSFSGQFVDFIYIDPPYNTRTQLSYEDNRVHSSWLEMMESRLKIAKKILLDTGFIAISIDDNEVFSLKLLMDEIFGERNFVHNLIWRKKTGGGQDSMFLVNEHEYVLVYAKNVDSAVKKENFINRDVKEFNHKINGKKAKLMKLEKWGIGSHREDAPTLYYSIKDPNGNEFFPVAPDGRPGRWRKKPENLSVRDILWKESNGRLTPYEVIYFENNLQKKIVNRSILYNIAENAEGTKELTGILGEKGIFDYPKPTNLIQFLINEFVSNDNGVVLDFFAGSGTTLHSVLKNNKENSLNHRSIIVTWNEPKNKIFDNVTLKRAMWAAKKYDASLSIMKVVCNKFNYYDDYLFALTEDVTPLIILSKGAISTESKYIFSVNESSVSVLKLSDKIDDEISKIIKDNVKMNGGDLTIFIRDDQMKTQKTIELIRKNNINVVYVPKGIKPLTVKDF